MDEVTINLADGQTIKLPADIAASDDLIRKALAPFYAGVAEARIERKTQNGVETITVIKRAGPKG